ncbi:MAG TPA: 50S ribosomal protein L30 [Candidatus Altiarchaeales archaeon]|nr:50S ribosomal protein L30 [Candidatus Altiarchaeales archaeon]
MGEGQELLAIIRVRGDVHVSADIKDTLKHLRLNQVNHCSLVRKNQDYKGMLVKVNDYATWGEVDKKTLAKLLKKRGRMVGDKPLTDESLSGFGLKSVEELASALVDGGRKISEFKGLKPVFRLNPPVGGHARKGIKKNVKLGGSLGYRGKNINKLLEAMM